MTEHSTLIAKKATELFVVGGIAFDPKASKHIFWYGVRKYPVMSKELQEDLGAKSRTEYIQKNRPKWEGTKEPPIEYIDFYKNLPEKFEEGRPERIKRTTPELASSAVIVEPTRANYGEATGESSRDIPVVVEMIKKIRQLIWDFPVEGLFTSSSGLQSDKLKQFISSNLKKTSSLVRMYKKAEDFRILPEFTRYIDVATGTIYTSEEAVKEAIKEYHAEPELMLAASKGGIGMTNVGELLKIADLLDEKGDFASADEITNIIKLITDEQQAVQIASQKKTKKAWMNNIVSTLVKVADSLDSKGATEEAKMADTLLQSLPQGFSSESPVVETPATIEVVDESPVAPVAPKSPEAKVDAPKAETLTEAPKTDAPKVEEKQETPFSELKNPQIDNPKSETAFDEMTITEFKGMIDGMKWRHSQGAQRQKYEEVLKRAEKAQEYFQAYKEWNDYAHKLFENEPIRIKIQ